MDLAIKLDNRLFERRQEQRQQQKPVSQYHSKSNVGPHSRYQQNYQQNRVFENRRDQVHTRQSGPATHNPLLRPDDPMDIDSAHRGPLTPAERQHRMSRGLCLTIFFMDSKLAQDLKIPLIELPNPIKLRLADGDSSSVITHYTVPLQLHIGNHVETVSFYVTSLCHGTILGYSWLERHNPRINWVSRMVEFDSSFCLENCCVSSSRIQGLGKPPDPKMVFPTVPTSGLEDDVIQTYPQKESTIELLVLDEPEPMENVGFKKPTSHIISKETQDIISANSIHTDIYPFVEATSKSEEDVPKEILSEFADKLQLCMDYRGLNKNTIKDRNPIPLISEMLRTLSSGKIFTTLDLRGAYNLLRIKDGDEQKTSFITKYGQFEFLVMPFGLANAPAQFQRMMNSLFQDMISKFVLGPNSRLFKYHLSFDKTPKERYYIYLGTYQEKAILDLKNAFSAGDFLAHPDDFRPFILETDASDFAISGILSQYDDQDSLRPVAFYSRQMNDAERNYEIYDKELLAVVDSFKKWRHFLQGGLHPIMVLCDHKNLEYFMTTKKLTRRQARWSLELSEYDFSITHRPGKFNGRADPLSRRHDYKVDDESQNFKRLLDPQRVIDIQSIVADMDLHILVYSEVLKTVFVQKLDWPLIVADFLAVEENIWLPDIPEDLLEKCKKELKHFRYRDDTFVRF
ncbi:hypothetical protein BASA83_011169 [Batrachochytrium salamandrivorans]|nr:hypothetical protein BASA83_011169 [Batrachochytrium salamandrivorans]